MAQAGEDGLLAEIFPVLPRGRHTLVGPGDDAAVVAAPDARVVVTTDVLVAGRHFRLDWSTGRDVGRRAAAANLADVAAMGARPTALVVALVVPGDLPITWVRGLAQGLSDACVPYEVGVVGGDLSGGEVATVAVTALGDLDGRDPVLRSGARPGDRLIHAGVLGRSAAGLALLAAGLEVRDDVERELVRSFLDPRPPVGAGEVAAQAGVTAMMDVSDGLLRDAGRLAKASGVVLDIDQLLLAADRDHLARTGDRIGVDPQEWVLTGGEDHGLLATIPAEVAVPAPFRVIGTAVGAGPTSAPGTVLVDGVVHPGTPGWDHFGG